MTGQNTGVMIAMNVAVLYLVMGPVLLFAIYVLFDHAGKRKPALSEMQKGGKVKDPALWTLRDVWKNF